MIKSNFTFLAVLILFLLFSASCSNNITITIDKLPTNTSDSARIYIAGSFNNWKPGLPEYELTKREDGVYRITLKDVSTPFEYKFTRGSWETAECQYKGQDIENRKFRGGTSYAGVSVENWKDKTSFEDRTTAASNVIELDSNLYMPQLDRYRGIQIYLPSDYEASDKRYPVLYMHDAQNIFDEATAYSQVEWGVDETLNQMESEGLENIIVVGINNSEHRMAEYAPWNNKRYKEKEGAAYGQFIVETLKPKIDSIFRTKSDRANTGIMGSSMGGLISMYIGYQYPDVFSKLGIFSPSFWFSEEAFQQIENSNRTDFKIYMNVGSQEGDSMQDGVTKMEKVLQVKGISPENLSIHIVENERHHESFWAKEFPKAYRFLYLE